MISREEILMGRDEIAPLTKELESNLDDILAKVNIVRKAYGKPLYVSSGYRPGAINKNAGGAKSSLHMVCRAVDFKDPTGEFAEWCLDNIKLLKDVGLWMEDPRWTITTNGKNKSGWVHLDNKPRKNRVFVPYDPKKVPPKSPNFWTFVAYD